MTAAEELFEARLALGEGSALVPGIEERARGSRPVVGSSRKMTSRSPIRLAARSSRRRMPPEYVFAARRPASVSSKRSSSPAAWRRASARLRPSRRPIMIRFSWPVSSSSTEAYCPVRAIS